MSEFKDNEQSIESALRFVGLDLIATHGEEVVVPSLKLAKIALSAFHPDITLERDSEYSKKGYTAMTEVNQLISQFESDNSLAKQTYAYSRRDEIGKMYDQSQTYNLISQINKKLYQQILPKPDLYNDIDRSIISTGEVVKSDKALFSLIFGEQLLHLLAEADEQTRVNMLHKIRAKLPTIGHNSPAGHTLSEWNKLFGEVEREQEIDYAELNPISSFGNFAEAKAYGASQETIAQFKVLFDMLGPDKQTQFNYPKDWYRSKTGTLVIPTNESEWEENYRSIAFNSEETPELGAFEIMDISDGIVTNAVLINPKDRISTTPIDKLEKSTQQSIRKLITKVAEEIGYSSNCFVQKPTGSTTGNPMDFIFRVNQNGSVDILYTRAYKSKHNSHLLSEGFTKESGIEEGYYMIKAGRNVTTQKYRTTKTPLALIELFQDRPAKSVLTDGSAFAMAEESSSSFTKDNGYFEVLDLNAKSANQNPKYMKPGDTIQLMNFKELLSFITIGEYGVDKWIRSEPNEYDTELKSWVFFINDKGKPIAKKGLDVHGIRFINEKP